MPLRTFAGQWEGWDLAACLTGYGEDAKRQCQAVPIGDTCALAATSLPPLSLPTEQEHPLSAKLPPLARFTEAPRHPTPSPSPACASKPCWMPNMPNPPSEAGDRHKQRNAGQKDGEPALPPQGSPAKSPQSWPRQAGKLLCWTLCPMIRSRVLLQAGAAPGHEEETSARSFPPAPRRSLIRPHLRSLPPGSVPWTPPPQGGSRHRCWAC